MSPFDLVLGLLVLLSLGGVIYCIGIARIDRDYAQYIAKSHARDLDAIATDLLVGIYVGGGHPDG